jgi:hypothetical protein
MAEIASPQSHQDTLHNFGVADGLFGHDRNIVPRALVFMYGRTVVCAGMNPRDKGVVRGKGRVNDDHSLAVAWPPAGGPTAAR